MKNATEYREFVDIMKDLNRVYTQLDAAHNETAMTEIDKALGRIKRIDYVGNLIEGWEDYER